MGEFTVTKWRCDRCGKVFDERPKISTDMSVRYHMRFEEDLGVAGNTTDWREVCHPCNEYIGSLISDIRAALQEE